MTRAYPLFVEDAFAVSPSGGVKPYPYSSFQVLGLFVVAFATVCSLVVCGLRVHSRLVARGFGIGVFMIL